MATEEIFYTDGQDIVVTLSTLQVKDRFYSLKSIQRYSLAILHPVRLPGIILFVLGVALAVIGMADLFPPSKTFLDDSPVLNPNMLAQWAGTILTAGGLILTIALRERYAVRIATEEGEKDAVISSRREYITEIVDAMNKAFMMVDVHKTLVRRTFGHS